MFKEMLLEVFWLESIHRKGGGAGITCQNPNKKTDYVSTPKTNTSTLAENKWSE
ncbi:hypothetical protein Hanom_Chr03g00214941 [Helianthus anomalus]